MNKTYDNDQSIIDPVCFMTLNKNNNCPSLTYKFRTYYFCAESCLKAFEKDPERYLKRPPKKGLWRRYLERLERATGGKSMNCH